VVVKDKSGYVRLDWRRLWSFDDVSKVLNLARRGGLIPWEWVSDARAASSLPFVLRDAVDWAQAARELARTAHADVLSDQPVRIEVWTEAADLMELTARITEEEYGVNCYSASGWSGPFAPRAAALRWLADGRPVLVLYLGDLDPDGIGIADRNIADTVTFATQEGYRGDLQVRRIGVTAEQVEAWSMPHEPGKTSHRNGISVPLVAQAEAIPPARLRDLLRSELDAALDLDRADESRRRWREARGRIDELLAPLLDD
jgi:hypothetical protein